MLMKNQGFTLVEMLITLVIGVILLTWAVPSFQETIRQNRLSTEANELITALNLARSEAIKRGANAVITASGGDWGAGWTITSVDSGGNAVTVQQNEGLSGTLSMTGGPASFTFTATGLRQTQTSQTLTLCDSASTGKRGRQINVSPTGRASVVSDYTCS